MKTWIVLFTLLTSFCFARTTDQVYRMGTSGNIPAWGAVNLAGTNATTNRLPPSAYYPPNVQSFTSGSGTYGVSYYFTTSSANATAGATYTNNGHTFTVVNTISSGTLLLCTSTGAPSSSGTLTKASGTGDATITFQYEVAPLFLRVHALGGGSGGTGGAANGNNNAGSSSAGGNTTFGSSLITALGGLQATAGSGTAACTPGLGGTTTVNSPAIPVIAVAGGTGGYSFAATVATAAGGTVSYGGQGGSSFLYFGWNQGSNLNLLGTGGQGAGGNGASTYGGCGGAGGGYVEAIVNNPSATYAYSVGSGGAGGSAGTGGVGGFTGVAGEVFIEEHWQ